MDSDLGNETADTDDCIWSSRRQPLHIAIDHIYLTTPTVCVGEMVINGAKRSVNRA